MAVVYLGNGRYIALAADTKPTVANTATNALLWETDTGKVFRNTGAAWVVNSLEGPYDFIIHKEGTTTLCRDSEGFILSSSIGNPETPIQYALDNGIGKTIKQMTATYAITAGVTVAHPETRWYMSPRAILQVPQGFTGDAILLENTGGSHSNCIIDGGRLEEAGTPTYDWTGIRLKTTGSLGMVGNRLSNTYIRMAKNCIALETVGVNSWINSNTIENMYMDLSENYVTFLSGATSLGSVNGRGTNKNNFNNLVLQFSPTSPAPLFGVKDVSGWGNSFNNCDVWDPVSGSKRVSLGLLAEDTTFNGGMMADRMYNDATFFTDRGIRTRYVSDTHRGSRNSSIVDTPAYMQRGMMWGRGANGDGLLNTLTAIGAAAVDSGNYTRGIHTRYLTAASALAKSGWKQTTFLTARGWNFYMRTKVAVGLFSTADNCRVWIGYGSVSTDPTGDNHYNAASFIGVGFRSTDTDWQIISNDGSGATTYTAITGVTKNTTARTWEIIADDVGPGFTILRDEHLTRVYHNTDIPAQQTLLFPICAIETTNSDQRSLDLFDYEIQAKRNL